MTRNTILLMAVAIIGFPNEGTGAGKYDGVYKGKQTIATGGPNCRFGESRTITIIDDRFTTNWAGINIESKVDTSGNFYGSGYRAIEGPRSAMIVIEIKGKILNGVAEGEFGTNFCSAKQSLIKQ